MVEVFSPDEPDPPGGGLEPSVRTPRRRGLPRGALLVAGVAVLALVGAIVSAASGDGADADRTDGGEQTEPDGVTTTAATGADDAATPLDAMRDAGAFEVATSRFGDRAGTRVPLLDGSEVLVYHPPGVDVPSAEVRLLASIWPVGMEDCCRRQILAAPVPVTDVIGDAVPVLELRAGEPGRGTLLGGRTRMLVFDAGDWTVSILASADDPFTRAELELYDRLVAIEMTGTGPPTVRATAPLATGAAGAGLGLDGPTRLGVTIFDTEPDGDCRTDRDPDSVYSECALGFQVFGFYESTADRGAPELAVSVTRAPGSPSFGPPGFSIAGGGQSWPREPVVVAGTRILTGGLGSGMVAGVLETANAVSWTLDLGDSAFVSPVVVDDTVLVAGAFGDVVAVDASTGERRWELSVDPLRPVLPITLTEDLAPDRQRLLIVPTNRAEAAQAPVVYGVRPTDGRALWETPLSPEVSLGPWEPVVTGDRILLSGIAAYDNRDALLVVQAVTTRGEPAWSHAVEPSIYTETETPVVATGTIALVRDGARAIHALDGITGELLWRHEAEQAIRRIDAREETVEIVHPDETSVRLDLLTGDPAD